jgi:hypothetical protein
MSELLRKASEEVKAGNTTLKQEIRAVGNKFLNAVEKSAQEAVYICLQLPMKRSSRRVVFVNTSPPSERVTLLKSREMLDNMNDESDDTECSNDIVRYSEMTKITISNQSHKSKRKYKSENGRTRTSKYIRGGIRCHGGVSIPC